jgi:hypothetical protein
MQPFERIIVVAPLKVKTLKNPASRHLKSIIVFGDKRSSNTNLTSLTTFQAKNPYLIAISNNKISHNTVISGS